MHRSQALGVGTDLNEGAFVSCRSVSSALDTQQISRLALSTIMKLVGVLLG